VTGSTVVARSETGWVPSTVREGELVVGRHERAGAARGEGPVEGRRRRPRRQVGDQRRTHRRSIGAEQLEARDAAEGAEGGTATRTARLGVTAPLRGGAVVFTQWFGSMLQLNPHLHVLVPEAQWRLAEHCEPVELAPPSDDDVAAVLARVLRQAKKDFADLDASWPEDEYEKPRRRSPSAVARQGVRNAAKTASSAVGTEGSPSRPAASQNAQAWTPAHLAFNTARDDDSGCGEAALSRQ